MSSSVHSRVPCVQYVLQLFAVTPQINAVIKIKHQSTTCRDMDAGLARVKLSGSTFSLFLWFQGLEEVSRTDLGKKIKEGVEEAAKTAKSSAETVTKSGEKLGKTGAFKAISQV